MRRGRQVKLFQKREKMDEVALNSPNKMAVLPGPLPDGRRSGGDEGLGSRQGAREAPVPRDSLNFRRASLLSRNEIESGTFTIVLHASSSFTYISVIYGENFPFNKQVCVGFAVLEYFILSPCFYFCYCSFFLHAYF